MTVLDSFVAFARALPADRREAIEDALAALMDSFGDRFDFTTDEMAELRRRAAESEPELSDPRDITQLFGRPFRS